jgi:glycosyltransferase involved in cell wall biosynthesis
MIRFSVIIPTYNRKAYLLACLETVFAQTHAPHEVIVVDDGSTDGTVEALGGYAERIQVIQQTNSGPGVARNRGAKEATGEYLAFLDSDDCWFPWTLQTFADLIEIENHPSFLVGRNTYFSDQLPRQIIKKTSTKYGLYETFFHAYQESRMGVPTQSACVNAAEFRRVGGFSNSFVGEDVHLWLRLGRSPRFVYIAEPPLAAQRDHGSRITSDYKKTEKGVLGLIEAEKCGSFPGGRAWRHIREDRLSAAARSVSISIAEKSLTGAIRLYLASMAFNLRQRRIKYVLVFPFLAAFKRLQYLF